MRSTIFKFLFSILTVLFFLVFNGCSKDGDNKDIEEVTDPGGYFMKFKIDGETVQFTETTGYSFDIPKQDPQYHYILNGGDGNSGFTINLSDNSPIEANKTYQSSLIEGIPEGYFSYSLPDDDSYTYSSWVAAPFKPEILSCTIKIVEVTDNNIKGTFFGEMRELEKSDKVTVAQGEFNVKRTILGTTP